MTDGPLKKKNPLSQILFNIFRCICGEAEDEHGELSEDHPLPAAASLTLPCDLSTSGNALLQTLLAASSSDVCSDGRSFSVELNGEAEHNQERPWDEHHLPFYPTKLASMGELGINDGTLLRSIPTSLPSSESCSDSSMDGALIHPSSVDLPGESITSDSLHQKVLTHQQCCDLLYHELNIAAIKDSSTKSSWDSPVVVDSSIEVLGKNREVAPFFSEVNSIKQTGREEDKERDEKVHRVVIKERWMQHYSSCHRILIVGDGDFSFSACLAVAFGTADNMIATSLNSEGDLRRNYRNAMSNIQNLRSKGSKVMHGVDATTMKDDLLFRSMRFDRIIFNFPHAGFFQDEPRESQLRRHKKLVCLFLANAKMLVANKGEIHISHKSNSFFREWNVEDMASNLGLCLVEKVRFNLRDYPGYRTKYGYGGDKNFNCNPSKTYKFGIKLPQL